MILLDSSVVIACLSDESGSAYSLKLLKNGGLISAVNYAEVLYKARLQKADPAIIATFFNQVRIIVVAYTEQEARLSSKLPHFLKPPLSLGDRACLATALVHRYEILTADKAWSKLGLDLKITLIR